MNPNKAASKTTALLCLFIILTNFWSKQKPDFQKKVQPGFQQRSGLWAQRGLHVFLIFPPCFCPSVTKTWGSSSPRAAVSWLSGLWSLWGAGGSPDLRPPDPLKWSSSGDGGHLHSCPSVTRRTGKYVIKYWKKITTSIFCSGEISPSCCFRRHQPAQTFGTSFPVSNTDQRKGWGFSVALRYFESSETTLVWDLTSLSPLETKMMIIRSPPVIYTSKTDRNTPWLWSFCLKKTGKCLTKSSNSLPVSTAWRCLASPSCFCSRVSFSWTK